MSSAINERGATYPVGFYDFGEKFFKTGKGVEWLGKLAGAIGGGLSIYLPSKDGMATTLSESGRTVQMFCKTGGSYFGMNTYNNIKERVADLAKKIFYTDKTETKNKGIWQSTIDLAGTLADEIPKIKAVIGCASLFRADLVSKIAIKRLTFWGDVCTFMACSVSGYEKIQNLGFKNLTNLEWYAELTALVVNTSLVALAALSIAVTFGAVSAPAWVGHALLSTYVGFSLLGKYHDENLKAVESAQKVKRLAK